jgi:hypothetical protein
VPSVDAEPEPEPDPPADDPPVPTDELDIPPPADVPPVPSVELDCARTIAPLPARKVAVNAASVRLRVLISRSPEILFIVPCANAEWSRRVDDEKPTMFLCMRSSLNFCFAMNLRPTRNLVAAHNRMAPIMWVSTRARRDVLTAQRPRVPRRILEGRIDDNRAAIPRAPNNRRTRAYAALASIQQRL